MLSIREEIRAIENGKSDRRDNPLKNAPHTQWAVVSSDWSKPYSREDAAFPLAYVKENKFWPSVARVNNTHGDRNLICRTR
jgi:glycine dehydrogenase